MYKIDSQQEFAVWIREFKPGLCDNLEGWNGVGGGREAQEGVNMYTYGWSMLMYGSSFLMLNILPAIIHTFLFFFPLLLVFLVSRREMIQNYLQLPSLLACLLSGFSRVRLCDPMDHGLPGSSVHVYSPGKNTGVGCHLVLQLPSLSKVKFNR